MTTITKPGPVRIPAELVARVGRLRGLVSREARAGDRLETAISAEERRAGTRGDGR
jgi:hypothetical protein